MLGRRAVRGQATTAELNATEEVLCCFRRPHELPPSEHDSVSERKDLSFDDLGGFFHEYVQQDVRRRRRPEFYR